MIEAELKARVGDPAALSTALARLAKDERSTYRDVYYDTPDGRLSASTESCGFASWKPA